MNFIELFQQYFPSFSTALGLTLQLALASLICASIIGIIFGMFSVSKNKILNIICKIYVDIIRGTPLVVQVFIMYYGVAGAFLQPMDLNWDDFGGPFMAAVVALSLNAGAYMAEIVRGGTRARWRRQEASDCLTERPCQRSFFRRRSGQCFLLSLTSSLFLLRIPLWCMPSVSGNLR